MLAPLTDLVGECGTTKTTKSKGRKKAPWHWDDSHQKAVKVVMAMIARDIVLAYPDFFKEFVIYTDASKKQLGSVSITQNNRSIAFFSRKLNSAHTKYSITKLELLSIAETLKEFRGMLLGQKIEVYDHINLTRDTLGITSDRVYRW